VSSDALRDRIADVVPPGVEAVTGKALAEERTDEISRTFLNFLRTFLVAFAVIALAVATLTITNTFSITVAQRSHELALLRAVGASRRQVRRTVTIEALVIGAVAGLVGLVGGIGVAGLLKGLFDAFGGALPAGGLAVRPLALVIGFVAGVAVTAIAAQVPARRASKVAPVEAMREADGAERPSTVRKVLAAVLTAAGLATVAAGLAAGTGALVALGAPLTVVGVLVAGPLLVGPALRLLGVAARRVSPRSGRLATDNARRQPRRSSATATALVIGVAVVSMCTVFAASLRASLADDIDDGFAADLAVTTPVFGGSQLSPRATDELAAVPGVDGVVGLGGGPVLIDGETNTITAADVARLPDAVRLDVERGSLASVGADGVAVSSSKAEAEGWDLGSPVELTFSDGATERLTVRAVYADQRLVGGVVVEGATWRAHVTQPSLRTVFLDLADGASPDAVRAAVEPIADRFGGSVEDRAEYTASSTRGLDLLLGIVYVLLALAVIIALAGIANALSLATHERRREIGLLRAVGQTRRQSRAVLRVEACLVSTFGTGLGLVLGCLGGWVLFAAVTAGDDRTFALPLARVVVIAVVGALAGVIAAARPGRRAARLPILEAVAAP
jgi:putative ABC transport system permease protein